MTQLPRNLTVTIGDPEKENAAGKIFAHVPRDYTDARTILADASTDSIAKKDRRGYDGSRIYVIPEEKWAEIKDDVCAAVRADIQKGPHGRATDFAIFRNNEAKILDAGRIPVIVGTVKPGDKITHRGSELEIERLGNPWVLSEAAVEPLTERFPEYAFQAGAKMQFANLLTPERIAQKEQQAAENQARMEKADKTRIPVLAGSIAEGEGVTIGGEDFEVVGLGQSFILDTEEAVSRLSERFPEAEFEVGATVQFASYAAPELENSNDDAPAPA